jgi:hypothetical protein
MSHEHHPPSETCADLTLACAGTVSPAFGPDGALWVAARVNELCWKLGDGVKKAA